MCDDWQTLLVNAVVMALAGCALIAGAFVLIGKAICLKLLR